jgi:hypothetical protein
VLVLPTVAVSSILDCDKGTRPLPLTQDEKREKAAKYLQDNVLKGLVKDHLFKPDRIDIEWDNGLGCRKADYEMWGRHPNYLYAIYIHKTVLKAVRTHAKLGLWSPDRRFLTPQQAAEIETPLYKTLQPQGKYKHAKDAEAMITVTVVTKRNIITTRKYNRVPDQIATMAKVSPNEVSTSYSWFSFRNLIALFSLPAFGGRIVGKLELQRYVFESSAIHSASELMPLPVASSFRLVLRRLVGRDPRLLVTANV